MLRKSWICPWIPFHYIKSYFSRIHSDLIMLKLVTSVTWKLRGISRNLFRFFPILIFLSVWSGLVCLYACLYVCIYYIYIYIIHALEKRLRNTLWASCFVTSVVAVTDGIAPLLVGYTISIVTLKTIFTTWKIGFCKRIKTHFHAPLIKEPLK